MVAAAEYPIAETGTSNWYTVILCVRRQNYIQAECANSMPNKRSLKKTTTMWVTAERGNSGPNVGVRALPKRRRMQESESGQEFGCRRQTRPSEVRKKDILTLTDIKGAIWNDSLVLREKQPLFFSGLLAETIKVCIDANRKLQRRVFYYLPQMKQYS